MSRRIMVLGIALVLITGFVGAASQGGLSVAQETLLVLPNGDNLEAFVYAVIENTSLSIQQFQGGLAELFDADSNIVGSEQLVEYDLSPEVLAPGETGLLYIGIDIPSVDTANKISRHALTLFSTGNITTQVARYPAVARYQEGEGEFELRRYAAATVNNETNETLRDFYAGFALKDENGKLLYVSSGTWASSGILSHSSMEIRLRIDSRVVDYWVEKGIVPATAEAIVFKTYAE